MTIDILKYDKMVHDLAWKYNGKGIEHNELVSAGYHGLLLAREKYNPELGYKFSTYAFPYIRGMMLKLFRKNTLISRGRTLSELGRNVSKICHRDNLIESELTTDEIYRIASELNVTSNEITFAINSNKDTIPINNIDEEGRDYELAYCVDYGAIENKLTLKQALTILDETDKKIIYMRFWQQKKQREIGDMLGMTQVQVSRKEKKAIAKLKQFMEI